MRAARDEELRGECAKAFEHYKKGNIQLATALLQKLLARHPVHPLLHFAYFRLAHMLFLEQRQPAGVKKQTAESLDRTMAAGGACPGCLLPGLIYAQALYDFPKLRLPQTQRPGPRHRPLHPTRRDRRRRRVPPDAAACPLNTADLVYAKAIATFDGKVFTLALLPDVRDCADSAAYRREALACLAKAEAQITDLDRQAVNLAKNTPGQSVLSHFIDMRDSKHAAEAARRLLRVQARAGEEDADLALVAVHRVMAGKGAAHNLVEAAAGWRESAKQGDASAQFLFGALLARGGGGRKEEPASGKALPGSQRRSGQRGRRHVSEGAPQVRGLRRTRRAPHDMLTVPRRRAVLRRRLPAAALAVPDTPAQAPLCSAA